jgi:hypothetical protein
VPPQQRQTAGAVGGVRREEVSVVQSVVKSAYLASQWGSAESVQFLG